jgi:predicted metal-dependent phosphoesterase TrpH
MKKLTSLFFSLLVTASAFAYTPNKIVFPNVEGYKTLKGDFHIHTIFSDGNVWPETRVSEAIWEGLDILSITDHLDTRSRKWIKSGIISDDCDRDTPYKLAKKAAARKGLLLINGGELSRRRPSGHTNVLFVKDNDKIVSEAEKFDNDNAKATMAGLKEARNQGAFIMWNHPHWEKYAPNKTVIGPVQKKLLKKGFFDAIEVYNGGCGYSPEAHDWCLKYNLAIIGCSDYHDPVFCNVDHKGGEHRVVTLVFAKEKSEASVREAMDAKRTAIFVDDMIYGREQELKLLFDACIQVKDVKWSEKGVSCTLENVSSVPVRITKAPGTEKYRYSRYFIIPPFSTIRLSVQPLSKSGGSATLDASVKEVEANIFVENFHVGANKPLKTAIKFKR